MAKCINIVPLMVLGVAMLSGGALSLLCLKCGQYNDGVGSITPCINYTHMQLIDCPSLDHVYCIKYISEGSTVRDCVASCTEKETWSARTYCCSEDGCNAAPKTMSATAWPALILAALTTLFSAPLAILAH